MKVKGPTNGAPPIDGVDGIGEVDEVVETAPTGEVAAPAPASGTGNLDPVSQVAAQLRSGEISVDQAVERLIDDAIHGQLGAGARDLEPKLRELLRSYAESDPFLAARIRRLTVAK
jgi:hypothetical protein